MWRRYAAVSGYIYDSQHASNGRCQWLCQVFLLSPEILTLWLSSSLHLVRWRHKVSWRTFNCSHNDKTPCMKLFIQRDARVAPYILQWELESSNPTSIDSFNPCIESPQEWHIVHQWGPWIVKLKVSPFWSKPFSEIYIYTNCMPNCSMNAKKHTAARYVWGWAMA